MQRLDIDAVTGAHVTGTSTQTQRLRRVAYRLSVVIVALMIVASAAGLLIDGLYTDEPWAREALRGGDLTTLLLAAPLLAWSLRATMRGSLRAQVVWVGALAYCVYNFAYYAFGAAFNDIFLVHVALLTASIWATAFGALSLDHRAIADALGRRRRARWVGGFLVIVGVGLGSLWVALSLRFAFTGELMADIPSDGVHLVFAIDLALLVPALIGAGIAMWRRTSLGLVSGAAMTVMGALYQVNLLVSGAFQAGAAVPGAKAFPVEGVVLAVGFAMACAAILVPDP